MAKNDLAQALPGHLLVETMDPKPKYTIQAEQAESWHSARALAGRGARA